MGFAKFYTDKDLESRTVRTEMFCHYGGETPSEANAPYDYSDIDTENDNDDEIEEIVCDPPPPSQTQARQSAEQCEPQDSPPPCPNPPANGKDKSSPPQDRDIPPGAKKLKLDWSKLSKRALPYKARLK